MTKRRPLYSERNEVGKPENGLIYDDVPDRVGEGLVNIISEIVARSMHDYSGIAVSTCRALDRKPSAMATLGTVSDGLEHLLTLLDDVNEFCDLSEAAGNQLDGDDNVKFANELNALFTRRYFGYQMRDGQMERVGARVQDEAIAEARGILRDPDLAGPDEQFQKAVGFFNQRPSPDCENCVKEAVSAVEGVAGVLLGVDSPVLSKALKRLRSEKDVHPTLVSILEKLYAYRGDAEGVAHALTGDKEVRVEEAEFVLGMSASAIVYLARLYGRGVD